MSYLLKYNKYMYGGDFVKCPKCETEIKWFDISPNCKKCGVHILYYTQEEDLRNDAKKTELEFAQARSIAEKFKTAFIGGKVQILRLVFLLLCVGSLVLPHFNISLSFPYWEYKISVGAIGIYNIISDSFWQCFDALSKIGAAQTLCTVTIVSFIMLLVSAVFIIGCAACYFLSFLNIKKTAKAASVFSVLLILSQTASAVLSFVAINLGGNYEFISVTCMYGALVGIITAGLFLASNIALIINEPKASLREADRIRLEIRRKLKKGEITLEELPLPIVKEEKTEKPKKKGRKKNKEGGEDK